MGRHSQAPANSRWRAARATRRTTGQPRPIGIAELEQRFFEFDRKIVSGILNSLRDAIQEGALQLEMVADERMFDELLSASLSRTSRRLNGILRKLEEVLGDVAKATGYPSTPLAGPIARAEVQRLPVKQS